MKLRFIEPTWPPQIKQSMGGTAETRASVFKFLVYYTGVLFPFNRFSHHFPPSLGSYLAQLLLASQSTSLHLSELLFVNLSTHCMAHRKFSLNGSY